MIHPTVRWGLGLALALALGSSCSSSSPGMGGTRQACYANGTCNSGLACLSNVCVALPDGGAGATGAAGSGAPDASGVAGTSGAAGAAAGAGGSAAGGDAAAGAAGGDAAAGTSGDAAADTSGTDAAAGTSGTAGAGGAICPYIQSYGNVVIANNLMGALEAVDAPSGGEQVGWNGILRNASTPDHLAVVLETGYAPFASAITAMTVDLSTQSDFQTCGACVILSIALDGAA